MIASGIISEEEDLESFFMYVNVTVVAVARYLLEFSNDTICENRHDMISIMVYMLGPEDVAEVSKVLDQTSSDGNEPLSEGVNTIIRLWNQKILAGELQPF